MPSNKNTAEVDAYFDVFEFDVGVEELLEQISALYRADDIPWVVGYSGGKDSTAVLQLVWLALSKMPATERTKSVYVISTDTLVENPIVAAWVTKSLERITDKANAEGLPLEAHRLLPETNDSYWVNLIGRGYPAPRPKFRWCTERMKIKPSNKFINDVVREHGEAIIVLGTRKAESAARAHVMNRLEKEAVRDNLRPHSMLPNSYVYSPIADWQNDDVWEFLATIENPWGHSNIDLLDIYRGANPDRECPLVVEEGTPSCGDSRFGCWVCTLVDKDKSMTAMIHNDEEKQWMAPLLAIRDKLIPRDDEGHPADRHLRDFRRLWGDVQLVGDKTIPGPYTQEVRENWLCELLQAQKDIRENGPEDVADIELITMPELHAIRRLWLNDKHEIEDNLPDIYERYVGEPFPDDRLTGEMPIGKEEVGILREICADDSLHFQLTRELLSVEQQHRNMLRRSGLFDGLNGAFKRNFFDDEDDAVSRARLKRQTLEAELEALEFGDELSVTIDAPRLPGFEDDVPPSIEGKK